MNEIGRIQTSARSFSCYCRKLKLTPSEIENYDSILDVGSGFSEFVPRTIESGTLAIAVDIGYGDLGALVHSYLNGPVPETEETFSRQYPSLINGYKSYQEMVTALRKHQRSKVSTFLRDYIEHNSKFIANDCFNLMFNGNSFDLATNVEMLARADYFTVEEFYLGLKEMLRVAKEVRVSSRIFDPKVCETAIFRDLTKDSKVNVSENLLIIRKTI